MRSEGKKGGRELLEKRRATSASLYTAEVGLADEAGSDAIPNAAGGEGGHRAAKPHGVIHRYISNPIEVDVRDYSLESLEFI